MTLWLGLSPMCADQVKNRHQCRKVALENTIKTMYLIMISPFVLRDFNQRNFPICYSVFLQLFFILLIVMATLSEMLCFLSTGFSLQTCGVVYSFTQCAQFSSNIHNLLESPMGCFKVSHSLINWYVVWTSVCISCLGYIAIWHAPT